MDKHAKRSSLLHYPVLIVFTLFFVGLFALDLITPDRAYSEMENTTLSQRPALTQLSAKGLNSYFTAYTKYVKDQVFGRDQWISLQSVVETTLLQKEQNGGILLGKEHMMFPRTFGLLSSEERTLPKNTAGLQRDLGKYRITYDVWFHESDLHKSGAVDDVIKILMDKGACYKAVGGEYSEFYKKYFVETKENVIFDVGISSEDEEDRFIPIALGGRQWYNIHGKISIILDDTESLTLVYRNRKTGEEEREVVKLHGIPKRPNKTSKFSVEVEFENPHHGAFIIKDVGFGKLFPTTNKIYRKEFDV